MYQGEELEAQKEVEEEQEEQEDVLEVHVTIEKSSEGRRLEHQFSDNFIDVFKVDTAPGREGQKQKLDPEELEDKPGQDSADTSSEEDLVASLRTGQKRPERPRTARGPWGPRLGKIIPSLEQDQDEEDEDEDIFFSTDDMLEQMMQLDDSSVKIISEVEEEGRRKVYTVGEAKEEELKEEKEERKYKDDGGPVIFSNIFGARDLNGSLPNEGAKPEDKEWRRKVSDIESEIEARCEEPKTEEEVVQDPGVLQTHGTVKMAVTSQEDTGKLQSPDPVIRKMTTLQTKNTKIYINTVETIANLDTNNSIQSNSIINTTNTSNAIAASNSDNIRKTSTTTLPSLTSLDLLDEDTLNSVEINKLFDDELKQVSPLYIN